MSAMSDRSRHLLIFCFFAVLVFFAKLPILDVPLYWDEMGWASQARWLSGVNLARALPGLRAPDAFWGHPPALHLTLAFLAKIFGYSIVLSHLSLCALPLSESGLFFFWVACSTTLKRG